MDCLVSFERAGSSSPSGDRHHLLRPHHRTEDPSYALLGSRGHPVRGALLDAGEPVRPRSAPAVGRSPVGHRHRSADAEGPGDAATAGPGWRDHLRSGDAGAARLKSITVGGRDADRARGKLAAAAPCIRANRVPKGAKQFRPHPAPRMQAVWKRAPVAGPVGRRFSLVDMPVPGGTQKGRIDHG